MLQGCLLRTGTMAGASALSGGRVLTCSTWNLLGAQAVRRTAGSWAGAPARRSDPGVFGTILPLPPACAAGLGKMFSTRSPGSPSASHSVPPQGAPLDQRPLGTSFGAVGTARTIGHGHRVSSNAQHPSSPGCSSNFPGQGVAGFPAADMDFRRPSARRSASSRSRSSDPYSTCDIASARRWWPARSAIWWCISWATQR